MARQRYKVLLLGCSLFIYVAEALRSDIGVLLQERNLTSEEQGGFRRGNTTRHQEEMAPLSLQAFGLAASAAAKAGAAGQLLAMRGLFAHPGFMAKALSTPGLRGVIQFVAPKIPAVGGVGAKTSLMISKLLVKHPGFTAKLLSSPLGRFGSGVLFKMVGFNAGIPGGGLLGTLFGFKGVQAVRHSTGSVVKMISKAGFCKGLAQGGTKMVLQNILSKAVPILNIASWAFTAYQIYGLIQSIRAAQQAAAAFEATQLAVKAASDEQAKAMIMGLGAASAVGILAVTAVVMARTGVFGMWTSRDVDTAFCSNSAWVVSVGMGHCEPLQKVKIGIVCQANDIACHRQLCEQACCSKSTCELYQFKMSEPGFCWLSDDKPYSCNIPIVGAKPDQNTWYGAKLSSKNKFCGRGLWACRSTGECVPSCNSCPGYSLGTVTSADAKQICRRAPEQAMCDGANWASTYFHLHDQPAQPYLLDEYKCIGLVPTDVVLDEFGKLPWEKSASTYTSGHDICQEACCADPDCVLYQVDKRLSDLQLLRESQSVRCLLGKVDLSFNPLFECRASQKVDKSSLTGRFLTSRGCPRGLFACLSSNVCVANCHLQCAGLPQLNSVTQRCDALPNAHNGQSDSQRNAAAEHLLMKGEYPAEGVKLEPRTDECWAFCYKLQCSGSQQNGRTLWGWGPSYWSQGTIDGCWAKTKCVKWKKCFGCAECNPRKAHSLLEEKEVSLASSNVTQSMLIVDAVGVSKSFFLTAHTPDSDLELTHLAEIPMILDQNRGRIMTPKSSKLACRFMENACGCMLKDNMNEKDCSCMAEGACKADTVQNTCHCSYKKWQPTCASWFYADDHLIPIIGELKDQRNRLIGTYMALLTGAGCKCKPGHCTFKLLSDVPSVRVFADDVSAISLLSLA